LSTKIIAILAIARTANFWCYICAHWLKHRAFCGQLANICVLGCSTLLVQNYQKREALQEV
jgi:hypothetical protein